MFTFSLTVKAQNTFPTNGNVGIGTLTPQFPLDVNGNARVTGNLLVGGGIITASVVNTTGPVNAGDINVTNNLNISGNAILAGSLTISSMVGFDNFEVLVNPAGQLLKGAKKVVTNCVPNAPAWFMGGNNILPVIVGPNPVITSNDIGTCNNFDFILKSNNIFRQYIKPDGKIGFGIQNPGSTGGPEYQFHNGVVRLSGMNSFGGPQLVFDGGLPSPHGDWGIEYLAAGVPGLNFWKPYGSTNSYDYMLFLADDGKVSVGAVTNSASARFNVDAWSGDGIKSLTNASLKAYTAFDKSANNESFVIYGNGATHLGANAQIGFTNVAIQDPNASLNINSQNLNGIKFITTNNAARIISVVNTASANPVFMVNGVGQTQIGTVSPNPTGLLNIASANPNNAIEVRNTANGNNIGFLVQGDGSAIIKSTYTTSSLDIVDATNTVNFRVTSAGYVYAREIRVKTGAFPDYVFDKNYKRLSIPDLGAYLKKNKHLPGFNKAEYYIENGINTSEMLVKQQETIEVQALYIIDLEKRINFLETDYENRLKALENKK